MDPNQGSRLASQQYDRDNFKTGRQSGPSFCRRCKHIVTLLNKINNCLVLYQRTRTSLPDTHKEIDPASGQVKPTLLYNHFFDWFHQKSIITIHIWWNQIQSGNQNGFVITFFRFILSKKWSELNGFRIDHSVRNREWHSHPTQFSCRESETCLTIPAWRQHSTARHKLGDIQTHSTMPVLRIG